MVDGKMGFLFFLAVVALGAIAWLLFRIDTKLQAIGNMIQNANNPEEPRSGDRYDHNPDRRRCGI